jgi:hypothetical protein
MSDEDRRDIGRLEFRVEGEFWNAYRASRQDSMDGAVPIESLQKVLDKLSECDCCAQMKAGCINTTTGGSFPMDVHACPQCRGADEDDE